MSAHAKTDTKSIWGAIATTPRHAPLERNISVEVAIVGGGITGVSAALSLAEAGKSVALLEARTIGAGTTGSTTGHLTAMLDVRYKDIERDFGEEGARLVAAASRDAIDQVTRWVARYGIECSLVSVPGYLFTENAAELDMLGHELDAASRAGVRVERASTMTLPFAVGGIRALDQAQMDAGLYLRGIEAAAERRGVRFFEDTRVVEIEERGGCVVRLENGATVSADMVLIATHAPLNRVLLQTKLVHAQSYVVAIPDIVIERALFWDTAAPYHYIRNAVVDGRPYLLVGGEDHRTGSEPASDHEDKLLAYVRPRFGDVEPAFHWSAQVIEAVDGLPYIGRNAASERVFVATALGGNGLTLGTVAALMMTDVAERRRSPYARLFSATRVKALASVKRFVENTLETAAHAIVDRFDARAMPSVDHVGPDEGYVLRIDGRQIAVYRDVDGNLHAVSAKCTHLGCTVAFNDLERTWDCPCHGSRFALDGGVLEGPATRPLAACGVDESEVLTALGLTARTAR